MAQLPCGYGKTVMIAAYADFLFSISKAEPSDSDQIIEEPAFPAPNPKTILLTPNTFLADDFEPYFNPQSDARRLE